MTAVRVEIERLLKQVIGLDSASIGRSTVERAIRKRSAACDLRDLRAYCDHVHGSDSELQALIEEMVVPETWFFRHREAFAALTRMAEREWLGARPPGPFRVLSLPCATGEEPYSIAMALLDAGLPSQAFRVDGVDISRRAIAQAENGLYRRSSFRVAELDFRDRHFVADEARFRIRDEVRRQVRFHHGNLLAGDWARGVGRYHAIFCRNLLIYFDRSTQDRAIEIVDRLLFRRGMLFVGAPESGLLLHHGFAPADIPMAFAFRKREALQVEARATSDRVQHSGSTAVPVPQIPPAPPLAPTPQPERTKEQPIETATRLANQGHLVEAERCCEQQLREFGPSAEAYYLIGLIREAAGAVSEADRCYRKALYLDRDHLEAVVHLALLLERQGHGERSRLLRDRAKRLARQVG
jgi:chemotaxis protein methyltransferase WspC